MTVPVAPVTNITNLMTLLMTALEQRNASNFFESLFFLSFRFGFSPVFMCPIRPVELALLVFTSQCLPKFLFFCLSRCGKDLLSCDSPFTYLPTGSSRFQEFHRQSDLQPCLVKIKPMLQKESRYD